MLFRRLGTRGGGASESGWAESVAGNPFGEVWMVSAITVKLGDQFGILLLKNIHGRSPRKKTFLVDIPFR
jgi:hypothetical protein